VFAKMIHVTFGIKAARLVVFYSNQRSMEDSRLDRLEQQFARPRNQKNGWEGWRKKLTTFSQRKGEMHKKNEVQRYE
jgi:hypothetical protein